MAEFGAEETACVIGELKSSTHEIGADIRALRKSRSMTLAELARNLGRSVGFISQLERGLSKPSVDDLRKIAMLVDVPVSFFFDKSLGDPVEAPYIVRANERRRLVKGNSGRVNELLSPDLGGGFEIVRCEIAAGTARKEQVRRETEEAGYVISGTFEIEIHGRWYVLHEGDSFRINSEPYRWRNRQKKPTVLIWVTSPPVY